MISVKDTNRIPETVHRLTAFRGKQLKVGVLGDAGSEILLIARVHEYGAPSIYVPERSFLRAGFDKHFEEIASKSEELAKQVLRGHLDAEAALDALGAFLAGKLQEYITDLSEPPLQESTIRGRRFGGANPLVDTGRLRQSITWKVVDV